MAFSEKHPINRKTPYYHDINGFRLPGMLLSEAFKSALTYEPRPDDIFIVTYPKCGTTWMQNIVSCILRNGKHFSSYTEFLTGTAFLDMDGADAVRNINRPGAIKTHLPFHLIPWSPQAKYIFVARNPKDCVVSFYHHTVNIPSYHFMGGEFEDYFELFIDGKVDFGDYFDTLLSWYEHRNDSNVLFITYEQLKKDTRTHVLKVAEFINVKYKELLETNGKILNNVLYHSSFEYTRSNVNISMVNMSSLSEEEILKLLGTEELLSGTVTQTDPRNSMFIRKGVVGDWKNYFSPTQNARLEQKYRERTKGTDIPDLWRHCM